MKKDLYFGELLKPLILNLIELARIPHLVTVLYAIEKVWVKEQLLNETHFAIKSALLPGFYSPGRTSVGPEKNSGFSLGKYGNKIKNSGRS